MYPTLKVISDMQKVKQTRTDIIYSQRVITSALFILSTKGGEIMALKIEIDESEAMDGLGRIDEGKDKAMKATRSDFRSRNASAVERGVQAHYNIKSGRVRKDKKAWRNVGDYGGEQDYTSSPLGILKLWTNSTTDAKKKNADLISGRTTNIYRDRSNAFTLYHLFCN